MGDLGVGKESNIKNGLKGIDFVGVHLLCGPGLRPVTGYFEPGMKF